MEEVSVWCGPRHRLPWLCRGSRELQAAPGMDHQRSRDLDCSRPVFASSIKTLMEISHRSGVTFKGDWQQRSGRNLVPASQTGLLPLLCPEPIPLLMEVSLPVPGHWGGRDRQDSGGDGEADPMPTPLAELPSRPAIGKGWDKHPRKGCSCPGSW